MRTIGEDFVGHFLYLLAYRGGIIERKVFERKWVQLNDFASLSLLVPVCKKYGVKLGLVHSLLYFKWTDKFLLVHFRHFTYLSNRVLNQCKVAGCFKADTLIKERHSAKIIWKDHMIISVFTDSKIPSSLQKKDLSVRNFGKSADSLIEISLY